MAPVYCLCCLLLPAAVADQRRKIWLVTTSDPLGTLHSTVVVSQRVKYQTNRTFLNKFIFSEIGLRIFTEKNSSSTSKEIILGNRPIHCDAIFSYVEALEYHASPLPLSLLLVLGIKRESSSISSDTAVPINQKSIGFH